MKTKISDAKSPLLAILGELPGGWHIAFAILEHVAKEKSESEEAKLMAAWEEVHAAHPQEEITPEMIASAAGITPSHMLGLIAEDAHLMHVNTSRLIAAISLTDVMERGIKEAKKAGGFKDRERILQNAGLYPAPAGVTIYNNPTAMAQAGATVKEGIAAMEGLDDFERDTLDSTSFLRGLDNQSAAERRQLESPAAFVDMPAEPPQP